MMLILCPILRIMYMSIESLHAVKHLEAGIIIHLQSGVCETVHGDPLRTTPSGFSQVCFVASGIGS